jgi:hypothetical protein
MARKSSQDAATRLRAALVRVGRTYPSEYRQCRDLGHYWSEKEHETIGAIVYRTSVCYTCTTERVESINKGGETLTRRYVYPEDYHVGQLDELGGRQPDKRFWRGMIYLEATSRTTFPKVKTGG